MDILIPLASEFIEIILILRERKKIPVSFSIPHWRKSCLPLRGVKGSRFFLADLSPVRRHKTPPAFVVGSHALARELSPRSLDRWNREMRVPADKQRE